LFAYLFIVAITPFTQLKSKDRRQTMTPKKGSNNDL